MKEIVLVTLGPTQGAQGAGWSGTAGANNKKAEIDNSRCEQTAAVRLGVVTAPSTP
jgi:hypothetical protein